MAESQFETMRVVRTNQRSFEKAIHHDTPLLEYRLTRKWDLLKFKDDLKPTIFHVQKLPRKMLRGPLQQLEGRLSQQRHMAFSLACHMIERPNGDKLFPEKSMLEEAAFGCQLASDEWSDLIADEFSEDTIDEMGLIALDFARLAKDAVGPFSLRHT